MLRLTAVVTMTIDHIAYLLIQLGLLRGLVPGSESYLFWNAIAVALRTIGRMAFPIFVLLITQGFVRTRDWKKYALRLFLLALVSEAPYDWLLGGRMAVRLNQQNVVFTLLICLLTLKGGEALSAFSFRHQRRLPAIFCWGIAGLLGCGAAWLIGSDYGPEGVILALILYLFRGERFSQCLLGAVWCIWGILGFLPPYWIGYVAVFLLIYFYPGNPPSSENFYRKGGTPLRVAEYLYYPVHLLIVFGIYTLLFK